MKKTLIVIGDPMMSADRLEGSLKRFLTCSHMLLEKGIWFVFLNYEDVIRNRLPDLAAKRIDVLLFFPYNHWNSDIEVYNKDKRIYGDTSFGIDFEVYLEKINSILQHKYKDKQLRFINHPKACIIDRDKLKTYNILKKAGIDSPRILDVKSPSQFYAALQKHGSLYIKPRFGAMGKGITCADRSGIYTNFIFRSGRIESRTYDFNWRPCRVSRKDHDAFIGLLVKRGFIFQEAISPLVCRNRRFDIRVYTVFKKMPYLYAKSSPVKSFITNWSQGGRIEGRDFLEKALSRKEIAAIKGLSCRAAREIGLSFAGIDIIIDKYTRKLYVLEIQSFPGYERGFDLMKFLAKNI